MTVPFSAVSAVITQNIDGLHQASGVPADRVIELHGNTTYAHCLNCGREYDLDPCDSSKRRFPQILWVFGG